MRLVLLLDETLDELEQVLRASQQRELRIDSSSGS